MERTIHSHARHGVLLSRALHIVWPYRSFEVTKSSIIEENDGTNFFF